jgi:hypothetical protein
VFYGLLLEECDRQQQADYLQLCLNCWGHTAHGGGGAAAGGGGGGGPRAGLAADGAVIAKLADFVERQRCLSAGDVIDMLQSPCAIGRAGALSLCDALLARAACGGAGAAEGGSRRASAAGGGGGGSGGAQSELSRAVELLARYAKLSAAEAADGVKAQLQQAPGQGGAVTAAAAVAAAGSGTGTKQQRAGGGGQANARGQRVREAARRARAALASRPARAAASLVLTATSLAGGQGLVLRVARLLPLLVLLHAAQQGRQQQAPAV